MRWLIWDGERRGGGERERERNIEWLDRALRPGKTEEAVDHRQNSGDFAIA